MDDETIERALRDGPVGEPRYVPGGAALLRRGRRLHEAFLASADDSGAEDDVAAAILEDGVGPDTADVHATGPGGRESSAQRDPGEASEPSDPAGNSD